MKDLGSNDEILSVLEFGLFLKQVLKIYRNWDKVLLVSIYCSCEYESRQISSS